MNGIGGDGDADDGMDPFEALAEQLDDGDADETLFESVFTEASVSSVEEGTLWEDLAAPPTDAEPERAADSPVDVISKRTFCEECQHLSPPPAVHCTHSGTEIIEYVDNGHVRVRNCPIVAQRRRMDDEE